MLSQVYDEDELSSTSLYSMICILYNVYDTGTYRPIHDDSDFIILKRSLLGHFGVLFRLCRVKWHTLYDAIGLIPHVHNAYIQVYII